MNDKTKMPNCETPRIDESTICSELWNAYPAGYLLCRKNQFIGQSQQNCFVHFIKVIIFALMRPLSNSGSK
jgi:hypothetical protein